MHIDVPLFIVESGANIVQFSRKARLIENRLISSTSCGQSAHSRRPSWEFYCSKMRTFVPKSGNNGKRFPQRRRTTANIRRTCVRICHPYSSCDTSLSIDAAVDFWFNFRQSPSSKAGKIRKRPPEWNAG